MKRRFHLMLRLAVAVVLGASSLSPLLAETKDKKKDPDAVGNRDVGKGVNFYSLEKEIALGKQLAQEVERVSETGGQSPSGGIYQQARSKPRTQL
jgi:hypothetical protein